MSAGTATLPKPPDPTSVWQVMIYAHTHWDREWYHPFERFRMQLVSAVDRIIDVLEQDLDFSCYVLDGQTIVVDDYLAIRPENQARLAHLISEGRLEVGPWYILPDEFLVSGESLVRNLLEGRRSATGYGATPPPVGYLPDPFGHVSQMPQILKGFGIGTSIFSRGMGDEAVELGSEFKWRSPDGSAVTAIVQTATYTNGYCNAERLSKHHSPENPNHLEVAVPLVEHLADRARCNVLLFAAGCDHETINPSLPVVAGRIADSLGVESAKVSIAGLREIAESVSAGIEAAGGHDKLGEHTGELRGALHAPILAAIFSARIPLKQQNVALQTYLERYVEPLMAMALASGVYRTAPASFLRHAWRLALKNQPHDSIGGCSVDEVHLEMPSRTARAMQVARGLVEELLISLGADREPHAFNPNGTLHDSIVERPDGSIHLLRSVPPMQLVPLDQVSTHGGSEAIGGAEVTVNSIESDLLRLAVDQHSGRVSITIKSPDASVDEETFDDVLQFVDVGDSGDEYDFGEVQNDAEIVARLVDCETAIIGEGVAQLTLTHEIDIPESLTADRIRRSDSTVAHKLKTTMRIGGSVPWVDCRTIWVNHSRDHRLRLRLSLGGSVSESIADGHFAATIRSARPAKPEFEWSQQPVASQYMESCVTTGPIEGRASGIAVFSRGLHEYEIAESCQSLEVTLLRSVGWLSREGIKGRPQHAGPELATPGAQCLGEMSVEYAITPYHGGWDQSGGIFETARAYAAPPCIIEPVNQELTRHSGHQAWERDIRARHGLEPAFDDSGTVRVDDPVRLASFNAKARTLVNGLPISTFKPADDNSGDLVLRVFNPYPSERSVTFCLPPDWHASPVRIDETPEAGANEGSSSFEGERVFNIEAGKVFTLRLVSSEKR